MLMETLLENLWLVIVLTSEWAFHCEISHLAETVFSKWICWLENLFIYDSIFIFELNFVENWHSLIFPSINPVGQKLYPIFRRQASSRRFVLKVQHLLLFHFLDVKCSSLRSHEAYSHFHLSLMFITVIYNLCVRFD